MEDNNIENVGQFQNNNEKNNLDEKKQNKKKNNKLIIIILIILIIIIFSLVILVYEKNKDTLNSELFSGKIKREEELLSNAEESILNEYGLSLEKANLENYIKTNTYLSIVDLQNKVKPKQSIFCEEKEAYTDGTVYLNKCKINNISLKNSYGTKKEETITESKAEIIDGTIIVYESHIKGSPKYSLNKPLSDNIIVHNVKVDAKNPNFVSLYKDTYISYMDDHNIMQLVDISTGNKIDLQEEYDGIYLYKSDSNYIDKYISIYKNKKYYLYNLENKEYISETGYDLLSPYINGCGTSGPLDSIKTLKGYNVAVWIDKKYGVIDYTNGKEIIPIKYNSLLLQGDLLVAKDNNKGHLFGLDGKEFLTNNNIENVYAVINNSYVIGKENNHIKLMLINGDEIYDFGEYKVDHLHMLRSSFDKINVEVAEESSSTNCIKFEYDLINKKGTSEKQTCAGISKPILYFYPTKEENIKVTFDDPTVLETTYPKYNNGWEVNAKTDGSLYDKNGKYYYALYWDEKKIHTVDFKEGFYVTKNNAIDFLEEKLELIGLNDKEKNEFIMYWLPILEKNKKSLVYFELTDERNTYSKINITPKPDSMLRLVIHIKKVNKKVNIKEQKLTHFDRKGFSAVEWGGTTY